MVYKEYKELLKAGLLDIAPLLQEEKEVYRLGTLRKVWDCYCDMQKRLANMFAYLVPLLIARTDPSSSRTQEYRTSTRQDTTSPSPPSSAKEQSQSTNCSISDNSTKYSPHQLDKTQRTAQWAGPAAWTGGGDTPRAR